MSPQIIPLRSLPLAKTIHLHLSFFGQCQQLVGDFETKRLRGPRDQWEAAGPVLPVAGEKPHARRVAAHEHSEAVVFDLVAIQSQRAAWRLG
jgi:hypothetical protein